MAMLFSISTISFATGIDTRELSSNPVVLSVPYSSGSIGISGQDGEGGSEDMAPESFFIGIDNQIYILDSVNSRIQVFSNGINTKTINVDASRFPLNNTYMIDLAVLDQYLYILFGNNNLVKIDNKGNVIEKIDLSSFAYTTIIAKETNSELKVNVNKILFENGTLNIVMDDGLKYNLSTPKNEPENNSVGFSENAFNTVISSGKSVQFPSFCTPIAAFKLNSISAYDVFYTSELSFANGSAINDRRIYFVSNGEIAKYAQLEQPQFTQPHVQYRVMDDGSVYQMLTTESQLKIVKLSLLSNYEAPPSYLSSYIPGIAQFDTNSDNKALNYVSSRAVAQSRCWAICQYAWVFDPAKHQLNPPAGVVQPQYLAALSDITPTTTYSIPYSWNGSMGLDVSYHTSGLNFVQTVAATPVWYMGNCCNTYFPKTSGLDCSGFVSVVYQLGSKFNTAGTNGLVRGTANPDAPFIPVSSAPGTPTNMDILNKPNDHVFIFVQSTNTQYGAIWTIYECTTTYNYRYGNGAHADRCVTASFYVDSATLTGYTVARLAGW